MIQRRLSSNKQLLSSNEKEKNCGNRSEVSLLVTALFALADAVDINK
jgi:hypothetical protein